MKKALALLLTLLALLPCIAACQQTTEQPDETTAAKDDDTIDTSIVETEDPYDDKLPDDLNYINMEHTFMFATPQSADPTWGAPWYNVDEDSGDSIDSAIYKRNRQIEARFDILIDSMYLGSTDSQAFMFTTYAISKEDVIDVLCVGFYQSGKPLIMKDYVLPWNDNKYIDLSRDWWNESITETLSLCGNYYYLSGDINWYTMPQTLVCYFNKVVAESEKSIVGDLYQTVRDGDWTFDTCLNIAKQISGDNNANGVWDANDSYGAIQNMINGVYGYVFSADYETVKSTEEGPVMNYMTQKLSNIMDFTVEFCAKNNTSYVDSFDYPVNSTGIPIFFDDRALLYFDLLMHASGFRDEESDFGIIPYPKYDDEQTKYTTAANQWGLVSALPCTASDPTRTGAILHAMGALSRKLVVPAYYEKTLMGKIKRDDESEEMLDIIFSNVIYDFGVAYSTNVGGPPSGLMVSQGKNTLASWWDTNREMITSVYTELYEYVYEQKYGEKPKSK